LFPVILIAIASVATARPTITPEEPSDSQLTTQNREPSRSGSAQARGPDKTLLAVVPGYDDNDDRPQKKSARETLEPKKSAGKIPEPKKSAGKTPDKVVAGASDHVTKAHNEPHPQEASHNHGPCVRCQIM
jgi:hypothetical protein